MSLIKKTIAILALFYAAHYAEAADVSFVTIDHVQTIEIVKNNKTCHYAVSTEDMQNVDVLVKKVLKKCK